MSQVIPNIGSWNVGDTLFTSGQMYGAVGMVAAPIPGTVATARNGPLAEDVRGSNHVVHSDVLRLSGAIACDVRRARADADQH